MWTRRRGSGFVPEKTATPVTQEASRAGHGTPYRVARTVAADRSPV